MAEKRWVCAAAPAHGSPGDVSRNLDAALERVREAKAAGALLLALPELCLTGDCGDLMRHGALQDACRQAALRLVRETGGMLCVFGLPLLHDGRLYNAAAVARDGRL
ncbi:MAG: NAD(+) synthase, partial [Clostridiales bacterium]|nr:NAD(+) synthase [Clostridiales bacterium]